MKPSGTLVKQSADVKMFMAFGKWIVSAPGIYYRFPQYAAAEYRYQELTNEVQTMISKADQKIIDADRAEIKAIRERVEAEHAEAAAVVTQPHGASIATMKGRPVAYFTRADQSFVEIIHPPVDGQRAQVDRHDVANVKEARAACLTANAIPWNF